MARGVPLGTPKRKKKREQEGSPSMRTELRGCVVFTEKAEDEIGVDLVFGHPMAGQEFVLPMTSEQNVELATLLLKGKPASTLQVLARELVGIEIASEMPEAAAEGASA